MKKILFAILSSLLAVACSTNFEEDIISPINPNYPNLTAGFEEETRTYVENDKYLRWHEDDRLTVFFGNTLNNQYKFKGKTGDNSGTFSLIPSGELGTGNSLANIYATYPYDATASISDEGVITYTLPATQEYAANSFGKNANSMVAVTNGVEDTFLSFKNLCGYLKLKLYGDASIKSIEVKGNFAEKIAGKATITATYGETPELVMNSDATTTIIVDCGDGVTLGTTSENATTFWVVIPETTFKYGITITATDVDGKVFTKSTSKSISIERNTILPMSALQFAGVSNEVTPISTSTITYTTDDGNIVDLFTTEGFGAEFISNTYDTENNIGTITFNGEINTIPAEAFQVCTNLTSVQIPTSVTTIAEKAFYGCNYMEKVIIPESIESVGAEAFKNCTGEAIIQCEIVDKMFEGAAFSKATITNTITGEEAFMDCTKLTQVKLPDDITTIPYCTFQNTAIETITLPETLTTLEDGAFYECTKLKNIALPESVHTLGTSAFDGCTSLQEIKMPATMQSIGQRVFRNCSSLVECTIPEGITTLESYSFHNCSNLTTLSLPSTLTTMYGSFWGCSSLSRLNISDIEMWLNLEVNVAETYESGRTPFEISGRGDIYVDGVLLTDLVIPDNVITIRDEAFYGLNSLKSVTFGSRVSIIGWGAFEYCRNLGNFTLPRSLSECGNSAFVGTAITEITITEVLANCRFYDCAKLKKVTFSADIEQINPYMFRDCIALSDITIPESVTSIGEYAFSGCVSLTSMSIPSNVTTIGSYAFNGCSNLQNINIPNGTTKIYDHVLKDSGITQIVIPDTVQDIEDGAFYGCNQLTSVTIPTSVKTIGGYAFSANIENIYLRSTTPPAIDELFAFNHFSWVDENGDTLYQILYVPKDALNEYKTADNWTDYADRIQGYELTE